MPIGCLCHSQVSPLCTFVIENHLRTNAFVIKGQTPFAVLNLPVVKKSDLVIELHETAWCARGYEYALLRSVCILCV